MDHYLLKLVLICLMECLHWNLDWNWNLYINEFGNNGICGYCTKQNMDILFVVEQRRKRENEIQYLLLTKANIDPATSYKRKANIDIAACCKAETYGTKYGTQHAAKYEPERATKHGIKADTKYAIKAACVNIDILLEYIFIFRIKDIIKYAVGNSTMKESNKYIFGYRSSSYWCCCCRFFEIFTFWSRSWC